MATDFLVLSTEVMRVTGRTTNVGLCPALKTVLLRTLKGARLLKRRPKRWTDVNNRTKLKLCELQSIRHDQKSKKCVEVLHLTRPLNHGKKEKLFSLNAACYFAPG